ncbi:MAG: hypothetical protein HY922_01800 [Elusimicrobia bacterium]|nr:hypothetical protein [Elusimicrobiota bacterium]
MNLRIWPGAAFALLAACASPGSGGKGAAVPVGEQAAAPPPSARHSSESGENPALSDAAVPDAPRGSSKDASVQDILSRIKSAYERGDYEGGLALVKEILSLKSGSLSVYDRIGSTYFALGRYAEALSIWQKAMQMEKNPKRRKALADSVALARRSLGLGEPEPAVPAPTPAAAKEPLAPKAPDSPVPPAAERKPADPAEIERLHEKGVEHYAGGEYLQAAAVYMRILELDPDDARAKKALERLRMRQ